MENIERKVITANKKLYKLKNVSYNSNGTLTLSFIDDKESQVEHLININGTELDMLFTFVKKVQK